MYINQFLARQNYLINLYAMPYVYGTFLLCILVMSENTITAQSKDIFEIEPLAIRANNWLSIQGGGDWEGLSENQIHQRQLKFDKPEQGIRAGVISLMTRALRKNDNPTLTFNQIFFEDDGWAENQESYKMDLLSRDIDENRVFDILDRNDTIDLVNFIASHEMGKARYDKISEEEKINIINKGIDMAYEYILSPDYTYYNKLVIGK